MTEWLVHGLIPKGHIVLVVGQPHSCKSWFTMQVCVCADQGMNLFGNEGLRVEKSSVIYIDEDTPVETFDDRIRRLAFGKKMSADIQVMTGFRFSKTADIQRLKALVVELKKRGLPILIIIDSLSTVVAPWNDNRTSDAIKISEVWEDLKMLGATVIAVHHISLKKDVSYKDFDFSRHVMGSTHLVSKCDTLLGFFRVPVESPTRFVITPRPRRTALPITEPFGVELQENRGRAWLSLTDTLREPSFASIRIFPLFYHDGLSLTIQQVMTNLQKYLSEYVIRDALHELEAEECLLRVTEKGKSHRYEYELNPSLTGDLNFITLSGYQERLLEQTKHETVSED